MPHAGDRSWLQLTLIAIRSPGRYPDLPSLWVSLKLRNSASHACLSFFFPVRFWSSREVMPWTTFWLVYASSHQCPVTPSQLVAFASRTHTTLPGWIPFPAPIGWLAPSLGLKGSAAAIPPRCCAMASHGNTRGIWQRPAAGAAASDLRKHLLSMRLLLSASSVAGTTGAHGPAGAVWPAGGALHVL